MSGGQALEIVVAAAVLVLLVVLTVLLARADRLLAEARGLLGELAAAAAPPVPVPVSVPPPVPTAPQVPDVAPASELVAPVVAPVVVPGAALALVDPLAGATLRDIATATLGPPLVRAAALGYGVRDVLAERTERSRRSAVLARRTRSRSSR